MQDSIKTTQESSFVAECEKDAVMLRRIFIILIMPKMVTHFCMDYPSILLK